MSFWKDKSVVVTGGAGFLGEGHRQKPDVLSHLVEKLQARDLSACPSASGTGAKNIFVPRSRDFDLREKGAIIKLYRETQPNIVIHLAAVEPTSLKRLGGGIGANRENPGKFFYDNRGRIKKNH